jgi:tRNA-2-methylthio-N6-dimethylallyladenosine synthase
LEDHITEEEKSRRLAILQEHQRTIQIRRNSELVGTVEEAFVEGYNQATGQWIGRTTQNRTLNFIHPEHAGPKEGETLAGGYWNVRVTRASPNSLAGEAVS